MASIAISSSASTLPPVNFHGGHGHGHKKDVQPDALSTTNSSTTGSQVPVGAAQGLFANLLQTLQQAIGLPTTPAITATAATTGTSATGTGTAASTAASTTAGTASAATAAAPTVAQDLHGFLHSLFQVLKQDGLGSGTGTAAASASTGTFGAPAGTGAAAVTGAPAVAGAGNYQGSLASSLQTLIQQVGSNGSTSPAIANLNTSFYSLLQGLGVNGASTTSTAAAGGTTPAQSSSASLQNFLNNLLQNLQANGLQSPKLTGSNVNANV
jgi:hypothetical protein